MGLERVFGAALGCASLAMNLVASRAFRCFLLALDVFEYNGLAFQGLQEGASCSIGGVADGHEQGVHEPLARSS